MLCARVAGPRDEAAGRRRWHVAAEIRLSEVRITCDEQTRLRLDKCQYAVIRRARIRFGNPDDVMTVVAETPYDRRLDVLVCHKHERLA
jgi:hypothetical protein